MNRPIMFNDEEKLERLLTPEEIMAIPPTLEEMEKEKYDQYEENS